MSSDGLIFFQYLAIFNTDNLPYSNKIFAKVGSIFSKCKLSSTKLSKTFKNLLSWQDFTEYGNTGRIAFRRKVLEKVSTKADSSFTKKYFSLVQRFLCRIRCWSILSEEKFWKREKEKKSILQIVSWKIFGADRIFFDACFCHRVTVNFWK